jgi:hypothetical protein
MAGTGVGICIILPIKRLYLNVNLGANIGGLKILNEYFNDKDKLTYHAFITPSIDEYFPGRDEIGLYFMQTNFASV